MFQMGSSARLGRGTQTWRPARFPNPAANRGSSCHSARLGGRTASYHGRALACGCYFALHAPSLIGPCQSKYGTIKLRGLCLASHLACSVPVPIVGISPIHVCWTSIGHRLSLSNRKHGTFCTSVLLQPVTSVTSVLLQPVTSVTSVLLQRLNLILNKLIGSVVHVTFGNIRWKGLTSCVLLCLAGAFG